MLKTALFALSIINAAFGLILAGAFFFENSEGDVPLIALLTGLALLIQAGFTIAFGSGLFDGWRVHARQLFVSGETASILAGGLAAVQGYLYNLHPRNGDFEFGTMALGVFMAAQAVVGLIYASNLDEADYKLNAGTSRLSIDGDSFDFDQPVRTYERSNPDS